MVHSFPHPLLHPSTFPYSFSRAMHTLSLFLGFLASVTTSFAAAVVPTVPLITYDGEPVAGGFIVKLYDGANQADVINFLGTLTGADVKVSRQWTPDFFNAFSGVSISSVRLCITWITRLPQGVLTTRQLTLSGRTPVSSGSPRTGLCRPPSLCTFICIHLFNATFNLS